MVNLPPHFPVFNRCARLTSLIESGPGVVCFQIQGGGLQHHRTHWDTLGHTGLDISGRDQFFTCNVIYWESPPTMNTQVSSQVPCGIIYIFTFPSRPESYILIRTSASNWYYMDIKYTTVWAVTTCRLQAPVRHLYFIHIYSQWPALPVPARLEPQFYD